MGHYDDLYDEFDREEQYKRKRNAAHCSLRIDDLLKTIKNDILTFVGRDEELFNAIIQFEKEFLYWKKKKQLIKDNIDDIIIERLSKDE